MSPREALEAIWWRRDEPAWLEAALWPLSLASLGYRAGAALARAGKRPARAGAPTISIGNLSVGGAGKTPVTLAIAERLLARGRRVAILSRGYGGQRASAVEEVTPLTPARVSGDEPALLKKRLPAALVLVGPRRALLAERAVQLGADALLLDDGLQHHALARDLDVLVVDASNPLGNGRLLPRGPLREGLSALGRTGLLWLTRADLASAQDLELDRIRAQARAASGREPVESAFAAASGAPDLRGKRVFLFAGIARPASFEALARALGAEVVSARWFQDHHWFTPAELQELQAAAAKARAEVLLTTEKDQARLPASFGAVSLPVELKLLSGAASLEAALDAALSP